MRRVLLGIAIVAAAAFIWWQQRTAPAASVAPFAPAAPRTPHPAPRLSVLLITIDTLRADRVGRGLTPAIDGLAGTIFTNVRATAPLTLPSHVSLMTGTHPPRHGVRENGVIFNRKTPTIARAFKDAGYRTAAFVGAYVLNRRFGLDEGFETYDDAVRRDVARAEQLEAERPGGEVVDAALNWLGGGAGPFFLWVHMYDPHAPYTPPSEYLRRADGNAYDGEVAYADAQVARLLEALKSRGLADSTIVAVAGDHGEALGEHGEQTHGMLAYDSTLSVPLVLSVPGEKAKKDGEPLSLAELGPRLLQATGVRGAGERLAVYAESRYPRRAGWHALSVLADDRWKMIRSSEAELYEIRSDPSERKNVASSHPTIVQAMSAAVDKMQEGADQAATVAPEAAHRLRALGYVSGAAAIRTDDPRAPNPARIIRAWTRFERALAQLRDGDAAGAARALKALAAEHPGSPVFQTTYAQALKDAGDPRAALRVYKAAASKWPTDPALFHDLAVAAREAGDLEEAMRAEEAALALDSSSAMAQNGMGLLHADAGRHAEAAAAFERACQLDPTNASHWTNLGNAKRAQGHTAAAEGAYRRALEADGGFADALNGLGALQVQAGRAADAVALFERALQRDPQLHGARLNLGIALQESGQPARAAATYRELLATAPPSARRERQAASELLKMLR